MLGTSCIGLLLGAAVLMWSPLAEAQGTFSPVPQVPPTQTAKIDRSLPGSRNGVLTKAKGGTVWIDRASYGLAPNALVENQSGSPLQLYDYQWDSVEYNVQYWLGTGLADRQITQLIIIFPE
jgi:hypothetical protein